MVVLRGTLGIDEHWLWIQTSPPPMARVEGVGLRLPTSPSEDTIVELKVPTFGSWGGSRDVTESVRAWWSVRESKYKLLVLLM